MAAMPTTTHSDPKRMQCMEVWGGNAPVQRAFGTPGLQVWLHSRPFAGAAGGGDVYYVSSCASGRITRLLLADVSGHGEGVAHLAVGLRDLMRRNVNWIRQTRFVREMNRQFSQQPGDSGFATAVVCTFFAPTRSLQFCNAGHPLPLLYRAETGKWGWAHELAAVQPGGGLADTPLGVIEGAEYSQFATRLSPGDMMLLVSDAFTESRDASGRLLGSEGLLRIVENLDPSEPAGIIPNLLTRLAAACEDNLRQDDATALLFRADGSGVSAKDNWLAPIRLFGPVRDNTVLEV